MDKETELFVGALRMFQCLLQYGKKRISEALSNVSWNIRNTFSQVCGSEIINDFVVVNKASIMASIF